MLGAVSETISHIFHPRKSNRHRSRILHPEALLILAAVLVIAVVGVYRLAPIYSTWMAKSGYVLGYASDISVGQVLAGVNQARQTAGLPALNLNTNLSQAAAAKAAHMMANQYWSHTAPSGEEPWFFIGQAGYNYRSAGENLARDFNHTDKMVHAWLVSPTHRANIMSSRYQDTGVAVLNGVLQGVETTLVVQMFGAPQIQAAQIPPQAVKIEEPTPTASPEASPEPSELAQSDNPEVLARSLIPASEIAPTHYYQPLDIIKSIILSLVILLVVTLLYDWYAVRHHQRGRDVGKNLAHILLLSTVLILALLVQMGRVI